MARLAGQSGPAESQEQWILDKQLAQISQCFLLLKPLLGVAIVVVVLYIISLGM